MSPIHKFFWDKNNIENNYSQIMKVAYEFGRQTALISEKKVKEFYLKKGNESDPIDYSIIFIELEN